MIVVVEQWICLVLGFVCMGFGMWAICMKPEQDALSAHIAWLGQRIRDEPHRTVRAYRSAHPASPDGANVVFVASGVEDPERKPAKMAGFRGGRYISAEASARGEWEPGGSKMAGADAYATSKQCTLATALKFARETSRLRFNAVEPGFSPATGLVRDANVFLRFLSKYVLSLFAPHIRYWSTPKLAAPMIAKLLLNESGETGTYYDEKGQPMLGSAQVRDPKFQDRVVSETRALLSTIPK
jgi:hypothetical protein